MKINKLQRFALMAFPKERRTKNHSINPHESLNGEIKPCTGVVGPLPVTPQPCARSAPSSSNKTTSRLCNVASCA